MRTTAAMIVAAMGLASSASASDIWLSGAVSWGANANGSSITEPGEYDNIVGTFNSELVVNETARGTTHLLSLGVNNFTYRGVGFEYNALSLYFGGTGAAFSRPFASAPDLAVYGSNAPLIPGAGALVQTNGQFSGTQAYTGATSFTLGDLTVTVTGFTSTGTGSGTLQLTVIPAPSGLAAAGLMGLAATRRRR